MAEQLRFPGSPTVRVDEQDIEKTNETVNRIACLSCEVSVLDLQERAVADRAKELGGRSVPAVAMDGILADCCAGRGPDEAALRAAGIGTPRS